LAPTTSRAGSTLEELSVASWYSPGLTDTFKVAVSCGLIGPTERRRRGPSIVNRCDALDWFDAMMLIGPAPKRAGEAITRSSPILTATLIADGGRGLLVRSSSPPQPEMIGEAVSTTPVTAAIETRRRA
jgi:hypothetical protein